MRPNKVNYDLGIDRYGAYCRISLLAFGLIVSISAACMRDDNEGQKLGC